MMTQLDKGAGCSRHSLDFYFCFDFCFRFLIIFLFFEFRVLPTYMPLQIQNDFSRQS